MNASLISGIYAITDPNLLTSEAMLLKAVEEALDAGISLLQYRDKLATNTQRLERAKQLKSICQRYQVPFIINDSLELAIASKADGVHLGQTDGSIQQARAELGKEAILGVTCHDDLALAKYAEDMGASYVAFGRFFPSKTKPNAKPAEISTLIEAQQQLTIPKVAIGGINAHNMAQIVEAGADAIAVIDAIFGQARYDPTSVKASTEALVTSFKRAI